MATLVPDHPLNLPLAAGQSHTHFFDLSAEHYAQITVQQGGIDVAIRVFDPADKLLAEVDSPNGSYGPEIVSEAAKLGGRYRLEVFSSDTAAEPGAYEISLSLPHPTTPADHQQVAAERAFHRGESLRRQAKFREATEHYKKSLEDSLAAKDVAGQAMSHLRLAWMFSELQQWQEALNHGTTAETGFVELKDRFHQAVVLNWIALARGYVEGVDGALRDHQAALKIFSETEDLEGRVQTLEHLGRLYRRSGRTEEAFVAYEETLKLWTLLGDLGHQATTWSNLGNLYIFQNKLDSAQGCFEKTRTLGRQINDRAIESLALRRLGDVLDRRRRWPEAKSLLEQSLALRRKLEDRRGQAVALNSIGTVLMKLGDGVQAQETLQAGLEVFRTLEDTQGQAVSLLKLGRVADQAGKPEEALKLHRQALALYLKAGDLQGQTSARFGAARALLSQDHLEEARELIEGSVTAAEQLRSRSESLELRATYFASKSHYWELYIEILMALHDRHAQAAYNLVAFEVSERWRVRSFLDLLQEAQVGIREGADTEVLKTERQLQERLDHLEQNRQVELEIGEATSRLSLIETAQEELLDQLDQVHRQLRRQQSNADELTHPAMVHLSDVQNELLDSSSLLLAYFLGEQRSFLWLVGSQTFESFVLPGREVIESEVVTLRNSLPQVSPQVKTRRERANRRLSDMLLGPLADRLGDRRLVVVSTGDLQYLPFGALRDPQGGRPLLVRHEIIHLPSASVLASLRARKRRNRSDSKLLAVVAAPIFQSADQPAGSAARSPRLTRAARALGRSGFAPLPHARDEASRILNLVPENLRLALVGFDANREKILSGVLEPYPILHFATHGLAHRGHPELCGLLLSTVDEKGRNQTGFLGLRDIYSLRLSADLVVLSACETGLGRNLEGEGLMGLTRGFFYAGSSGIISSLWPVSDHSTSELMPRFYRRLFEDQRPPPAALRAAQLSMLAEEKWSEPFHWAGFIYQGDWAASFAVPGDDPIEIKIVAPPTPDPDDPTDDDLPGPKASPIPGPKTEGSKR